MVSVKKQSALNVKVIIRIGIIPIVYQNKLYLFY